MTGDLKMDFANFVSWAFYGLISFGFFRVDKIMTGLKKSVDELNITIAVEIQKMSEVKIALEDVKEQCKDHERRLQMIEVGCALRHKKE